ncbi:hypothetical protein BH11ARM1_BH11ARM1_06490 [soil metagenome]
MKLNKRILLAGAVLSFAAVGATQVQQLLKVLGVGEVVQKFGPDINKAVNKLSNHKDTTTSITKVVPIISGGIGGRTAIGAAQVMGKKADVDKVNAVAQIEQDILGKEVKIRAMIPITSKDVIKDIRAVPGVGISGIVDLKI